MILPTKYLNEVVENMVLSDSIANILIFDSGVGGLSVYQEIHRRLPNNNYIYLFDNEAYPYGELTIDVLLQRATHLINSIVAEKEIDLVVVACNTASTVVLPVLRTLLTIPVVGVVPAIKPACLASKHAIGLLATPATITRPYTHELINAFASEKEVALLGSTELVDMAEDKLRGIEIDLSRLQQIVKPLLGKVDVVVLGCTHFPLIRDEIQKVMGNGIMFVDSGKAIALRVESLLQQEEHRDKRNKVINQIFASATPKSEVALLNNIKKLGFSKISLYPYLGL
jgi:glutamate racemase